MSNTDDFDTEVNTADAGEFEQAGSVSTSPKKSGGFIFKLVILLIAVGGVLVGAQKMGISLPFSIPFIATAPAVMQQVASEGEVVPPAPAAAQQLAPADVMGVPPSVEVQQPTTIDGGTLPSPVEAQQRAVPVSPQEESSNLLPDAIGTTRNSSDNGVSAPVNPVLQAASPVPPSAPDSGDPLAWSNESSPPPPSISPPKETPKETPKEITLPQEAHEQQGAPSSPVMPSTPAIQAMGEQMPAMPGQQAAAVIPVPTAPSPSASTPETRIDASSLEQRIISLEAGLKDVRAGMATKTDVDSLRASIESLSRTSVSKPDAVKTAVVKEAKKESTRRKSASAQKTAKKTPVKAVANWTLKAAKPGMAWMVEAGSEELHTVVVGDNVAGIGKVTAIVKDSTGKWVVNGTKGWINQ